jgi:hypothetical protein
MWKVLLDIVTLIASVITTGILLGAFVFSTPANFNNWLHCSFKQCHLEITEPKPNTAVSTTIDIKGTAENVPEGWQLVVLTQTPDELKYYITSGGALAIGTDRTWHINQTNLGAGDAADANKVYRIVALLIDEEGQRQLQAVLAKPDEKDHWLASLPRNGAKVIRDVTLQPLSPTHE